MHTLTRCLTGAMLILVFIATLYTPATFASLLIACIALYIVCCEWPQLATGYWWLATPVYPALPFVLAVVINEEPIYRPLLCMLVIGVAAHDTGAYFIGRFAGTHKLCPTISPGKTWQGLFGGMLCVWAAFLCMAHYFNTSSSWLTLLCIASIVSFAATAGDLFESWLKRRAGVKDSGTLLPGHGGFLDRCDGMMSCMYLLYPLRHILLQMLR